MAEGRLRVAAQQAGFKNISFQFEPVAASLAFEQTLHVGQEKIVLIGDFGGGTSDFTIIKLRRGVSGKESNRNILALGGIYLGGDIFDSRIMWHKIAKYFGKSVRHKSMTGQWLDMPAWILQTLCQWHLIPQLRKKRTLAMIREIRQTADDGKLVENLENLIKDNFGYFLFQSIERAKVELSVREESQIIFRNQRLSVKDGIKRVDFNEMICEDVSRIKKCLERTIFDSGLVNNEIDQAIITGGTSYVPCIKRLFVDKFGEEKVRQIAAFTSVAYGLGISADQL